MSRSSFVVPAFHSAPSQEGVPPADGMELFLGLDRTSLMGQPAFFFIFPALVSIKVISNPGRILPHPQGKVSAGFQADLAVFLFWCGMYVTFLFLIHQRSFSILFESFFIIIHILPLIGHQTDILPYQSSIFCFIVIYERYERNPQIIIQ